MVLLALHHVVRHVDDDDGNKAGEYEDDEDVDDDKYDEDGQDANHSEDHEDYKDQKYDKDDDNVDEDDDDDDL